MTLVDRALRRREEEGDPIKILLVGAGAMGRALAYQVTRHVPGMEISVIANRTAENAVSVYAEAGVDNPRLVTDLEQLDAAIQDGQPAVTADAEMACGAAGIDVVWEVTGAVEFGCHIAMRAIEESKHLVTMNAEMQGTVGPILKRYADDAGVILTDSEGDQPGVMMNLYHFTSSLGVRPVLLGNLKGLHDPYRNYTTQIDFATRKGLTPNMAASFADGTKMSFEMSLVANATGLRAGRVGLYGYEANHVSEAASLYDVDELLEVGLVDYLVGAEPAPGVFCLGTTDEPFQRRWLELYKLGDGPLYLFYTPYHLCHLEAPRSIARAVDHHDPTVTPDVGHVVDVVATAKKDLEGGEVIDGIGFYMTYGQCANASQVAEEGLLPMGLAEGARLTRAVSKDSLLTFDDVELPEGRLVDRLWQEQTRVCPPVRAS